MNSPTVSVHGLVEHGRDDVHQNGTSATTARNSFGPKLVDDRAHQEATGTSAFDRELLRRRPPRRDQRLGADDEVVERGLLVRHLAGFVPAAAEVAAAADVGDSKDDAAVEQRDARLRERRIDRDAVATVAVEEQRLRSGALLVAAVDERDRDRGAVAGARRNPFAGVERRLVAGHRLALPQHALARRQVVVVARRRRRQRGVDEAQARGVELGVAAGVDAVGRLVEGDRVIAATFQVEDAQLQAAFDPLGDDEVLGEDVDAVEHDVGARRAISSRRAFARSGAAASTLTRRKLRPVSLMRT